MGKRLSVVAAGLGLVGSVACSVAMVAALLGLLGAGVAGMAGMAGMSGDAAPTPHSSLPASLANALFFLIKSGPVILIVSIAAVALAVAARRRVGLLPVAVAGLLLYWGMYLQATRFVMYSAMVLGLAALAGTYLWSNRPTKDLSC